MALRWCASFEQNEISTGSELERPTVRLVVAAVNEASDVKQPIDSIMPAPVNQREKAIRAADHAAMFCWTASALSIFNFRVQ